MNKIFFFICLITNIPAFPSLNNPDYLPSDYPFSIKKDTNTAIIFSSNYITLFDVTKTSIPQDPLVTKVLIDCPSGEEKGGIFYNDYYYTSCLDPSDNTKFQIKKYDSSLTYIETYPSDDVSYSFTSSIRFFITSSAIEAVWLNDGVFNFAKFDNSLFKQHTNYPVANLARDTDCVYITSFNKIICAFGLLQNGEYACAANIFTDEDSFISNVKIWNVCNDHKSRKLRLDNNNRNSFYYYFVDNKFDAYVLPLTMTNEVSIQNGNALKVMSGCDEKQISFDLSENKFNGFFVWKIDLRKK